MKKTKGTVLIGSGASGGHLIPALAVAEVLRKRGWKIMVVLGGGKFAGLVKARGYRLEALPASGFNVRNPLRQALALLRLLWAVGRAFALVRGTRPQVVFGTGGYATVALMLAARALGVPCVGHEQNVLPGRANRFLARLVAVMTLTFAASRRHLPAGTRTVAAGMPLRAEVLAARRLKRRSDGKFRLLVVGGSQGSRLINDVVPAMLGLMPAAERKGIEVVHQARPEDAAAVVAAYRQLKVPATVKAFFDDLPARTRAAHLVIGRSGAGTVIETAVLGRAAIYVPLALADGHQALNAQVAEKAGAAVVLAQALFTQAGLLVHVRAIRKDPARLAAMEQAAAGLLEAEGAAARVADAVEKAARA
jgi:UDP-N-acetylglucosamine--N-acetylmuramyl-(pentapeptide) pyrophosphoryl-undecaprenol N-acetylglucosamine transferase